MSLLPTRQLGDSLDDCFVAVKARNRDPFVAQSFRGDPRITFRTEWVELTERLHVAKLYSFDRPGNHKHTLCLPGKYVPGRKFGARKSIVGLPETSHPHECSFPMSVSFDQSLLNHHATL